MRSDRRALASLLLVVGLSGLTACGALDSGKELEPQTVIVDVQVDTAVMLNSLNAYRKRYGQAPLVLDERLNAVSRDMALHIAQRDSMDTWAHSAFGLSQRLDKARYPNYAGAENLGAGYADLSAAFDGWKGSKGHNKNLLNPHVTRVGIARANRSNGTWRHFWVMTLARPFEDGRPVLR